MPILTHVALGYAPYVPMRGGQPSETLDAALKDAMAYASKNRLGLWLYESSYDPGSAERFRNEQRGHQ